MVIRGPNGRFIRAANGMQYRLDNPPYGGVIDRVAADRAMARAQDAIDYGSVAAGRFGRSDAGKYSKALAGAAAMAAAAAAGRGLYNRFFNKRKQPAGRSSKKKRRAIGRVKGKGGYLADAGTLVGTGAGALLGMPAAMGGGMMLGAGMGGGIGHAGGSLIENLTGMGAYDVSMNSLMSPIHDGVQVPQFASSQHATVIRHREYIQDVTAVGATAFTNTVFPLNPGVAATFPFLAAIAGNFDQYQILGMIFEFKTLSSDITAGGALGSIILSTDYDVANTSFQNKQEMENAEFCTSNKPSVDTIHCIECDPSESFCPLKFIRTGVVPTGKDPRLYDHANFQMATSGLPSSGGTVLGELWCSYEVALFKPNLQNSLSTYGTDHFQLPTTITSSHYLSADTTVVYTPATGSLLGGTLKGSTYSFPANVSSGNFLVIYAVTGTSTTLTTNVGTFTKHNCVALNLFVGDTSDYQEISAGASSVTQMIVETVTVTATGATFAVASGTLPNPVTSGDLFVIGLSVGLQ